MKTLKRLFTTLFLLCIAGMAMAQDVIVMKDQSTIMSKVLEITSTEIKYKKWDNQDGPLYSVSRSEIMSINYENGEVEFFTETANSQQKNNAPQVQYLNSYMTYSGAGRLFLNGRVLSDIEVRNLVTPQGYQQYLKGRRQAKTGFVLDVVGGIALAVAGAMKLFNDDLNTLGPSVVDTPAFKTEIALLASGLTVLGAGIIIGMFGSDNAQKVAETYNQAHGNTYSFNLSPSLMKCETPQSANNYGLGLTLSMNF